jgi:NDP-hexose 4,6-dehydratase
MDNGDLVAVTGADGFIGSHLAETLARSGRRVRAMVQYNSLGSWGWLGSLDEDVLDGIEVVPGDVRDPACVHGLLRDANVVYHLAALIAIPYSYQVPRSYMETNAIGTLNVLEAVRANGVERLVQTSTSEVYGTARSVPISESHPLQAQSPYAASKVAADKLVESYHLSFGVPAVTLRPFNTYGPRQSARAVIPTIISQLAAGVEVIELGGLKPTRDFQYVQDTVRAFVAAGTAPASAVVGRTFNAGTGVEISVADLAQLIAKLMERPCTVRSKADRLRPERSEVLRLVADSTQLREATGWSPAHTLQDGLAETIEWFRQPANLAQYRADIYNR